MEAHGLDAVVRTDVHYFNSDDEVHSLVDAAASLAKVIESGGSVPGNVSPPRDARRSELELAGSTSMTLSLPPGLETAGARPRIRV